MSWSAERQESGDENAKRDQIILGQVDLLFHCFYKTSDVRVLFFRMALAFGAQLLTFGFAVRVTTINLSPLSRRDITQFGTAGCSFHQRPRFKDFNKNKNVLFRISNRKFLPQNHRAYFLVHLSSHALYKAKLKRSLIRRFQNGTSKSFPSSAVPFCSVVLTIRQTDEQSLVSSSIFFLFRNAKKKTNKQNKTNKEKRART